MKLENISPVWSLEMLHLARGARDEREMLSNKMIIILELIHHTYTSPLLSGDHHISYLGRSMLVMTSKVTTPFRW